jgi:hypothetical protein
MQRMNRSLTVERESERGATAVLTALLMTAMVAATGLAVDMGANYATSQELQNGADAAALAVAQEHAEAGCLEDTTLAGQMARGNVRTQIDPVNVDGVTCGTNSVQVDLSAVQEHWFMPVVGLDSSTLGASATVEWGSPSGGISMLPIAISACSYYEQVGVDEEARLGDTVNLVLPAPSHGDTDCSWHADYPAGGFGWLDPTDGCGAYSEIGAWVGGDTGQDVPGPCTWSDFNSMLGETVLLPVFDEERGTGSGGEYHIQGYAAILFTGFHFNTLSSPKSGGAACSGAPTGQKACIIGEFQGYFGLDDDWEIDPGTPGDISIIRLTD